MVYLRYPFMSLLGQITPLFSYRRTVFGWHPAISATCATNRFAFVLFISILQRGSGWFDPVNHSKQAVSTSQNATESVIDSVMENAMENAKCRKIQVDDFRQDGGGLAIFPCLLSVLFQITRPCHWALPGWFAL